MLIFWGNCFGAQAKERAAEQVRLVNILYPDCMWLCFDDPRGTGYNILFLSKDEIAQARKGCQK